MTSDFRRPIGNGKHVINPIKGVLNRRNIIIISTHPGVQVGEEAIVGGVRRKILKFQAIPESDITVCLTEKFPLKCKPLRVSKDLPSKVLLMHSKMKPQWFKIVAKWGYNTQTGMLWVWPEQDKVEGEYGDSGIPWLEKTRFGWRVTGHTKAANDQAAYGPAYSFFKEQIKQAIKTLKH